MFKHVVAKDKAKAVVFKGPWLTGIEYYIYTRSRVNISIDPPFVNALSSSNIKFLQQGARPLYQSHNQHRQI